jgi:hypothetical protein
MKLYQYEIMDRCHVFINSIDASLLNHRAITDEQRQFIEDAISSLSRCYQAAGTHHFYQTGQSVSVQCQDNESDEPKEV